MRRVLLVVRMLVAGLLLATLAVVVVGRVRLEPVLTGSMAPRYPVGTLVAVTPVRPGSIRVGDVVMFVPPAPYRTPTGGPVLHRVVSIATAPGGQLLVRTKGDANPAPDPWTVDASRGGLMRLRGSSVVAGRVLEGARHTTSGPALLVWPGVLLMWLAARTRRQPSYRPRHAL